MRSYMDNSGREKYAILVMAYSSLEHLMDIRPRIKTRPNIFTGLKLFVLVLLVSCSTHGIHKKKGTNNVEPVEQSQRDFSVKSKFVFEKARLPAHKKDMIKAYFDYYAYSLKNECHGMKYQRSYPGRASLELPELQYGYDPQRSVVTGPDLVTGYFFDLTHMDNGNRLENFVITANIREIAESPERKLLLLKTGSPTHANYQICSGKSGTPLVCTQDKVIAEMVDVNNLDKFCGFMENPIPTIPEDKLLNEIVKMMVKLDLFRTTQVS